VLGFVVVVPFAAAAAVSGRVGRAALALVGFVAVVSLSQPVSANVPPPGAAALGAGNVTVTCTPWSVLYYDYTSNSYGRIDGQCPAGGSVVCGRNTLVGGNYPQWYGAGTCYEVFVSAGSGGGSTGGSNEALTAALEAVAAAAAQSASAVDAFSVQAQNTGMPLSVHPSLYVVLGMIGAAWILFRDS
jgi:hypothetical protein